MADYEVCRCSTRISRSGTLISDPEQGRHASKIEARQHGVGSRQVRQPFSRMLTSQASLPSLAPSPNHI